MWLWPLRFEANVKYGHVMSRLIPDLLHAATIFPNTASPPLTVIIHLGVAAEKGCMPMQGGSDVTGILKDIDQAAHQLYN